MQRSDSLSKKKGVLKDGILSILVMMSVADVPGQTPTNHFVQENMFAMR